MSIYRLVLLTLFSCLFQAAHPKPKVVIFSSTGGGGHVSASQALQEYLKDRYEVRIVNLFQDVLAPLDIIKTISFGSINCEEFYNFCLQLRWTHVINKLGQYGSWSVKRQTIEIEQLTYDFLKVDRPDILISVIPLVNGPLLRVAERLQIPFVVIPTDLTITTFVQGLEHVHYPSFRLLLPFEDTGIAHMVHNARIDQKYVRVSGFPVKPAFVAAPAASKALKTEFGVPQDKPVVMILMGAAGSAASYHYVKLLARAAPTAHLLVVLGRNEGVRRRLARIHMPPELTITLFGFTDRIADLMSIADVIITKAGTVSVCESIYRNVPMIIDNTQGSLTWESYNPYFIQKYALGDVLTHPTELPELLDKYINCPHYRNSVKRYLGELKKELFAEHIHPILTELRAQAVVK